LNHLWVAKDTRWGITKQCGELNNRGNVGKLGIGIDDGFMMGAIIKKLDIEKISPLLSPLLKSVS
jgi:hypothetical protein